MILFQIIASVFILLVLGRIVSRFRNERIPKSELIIWGVFWLLIAVAIWWPSGTDHLARLLGISRGYELVVAVSVALLFYLMFQLFSHVHDLQRQVTDLTRELAVEKHFEESEQTSSYAREEN